MKKGKLLSTLKNTSRIPLAESSVQEDLILQTGIVRESPVDILYMRKTDGSGKRFIRVRVHSRVRAGLHRYSDIECKGSQQEMQQRCGMVAGVIAEQLAELYGDIVDPSECAMYAGRHFKELCDHLEKAATNNPHTD